MLVPNGHRTAPNMSQAEVRPRGRRVCVERKQAWDWLEAEITLYQEMPSLSRAERKNVRLGFGLGAGVLTKRTPHSPSHAPQNYT